MDRTQAAVGSDVVGSAATPDVCHSARPASAGLRCSATQGFNQALKSTMAQLRNRAMTELTELASVGELEPSAPSSP